MFWRFVPEEMKTFVSVLTDFSKKKKSAQNAILWPFSRPQKNSGASRQNSFAQGEGVCPDPLPPRGEGFHTILPPAHLMPWAGLNKKDMGVGLGRPSPRSRPVRPSASPSNPGAILDFVVRNVLAKTSPANTPKSGLGHVPKRPSFIGYGAPPCGGAGCCFAAVEIGADENQLFSPLWMILLF